MDRDLYMDTTPYSVVKRIASFLDIPDICSILDPGCGDGTAIAELKGELEQEFGNKSILTYGIEQDLALANEAKNKLTKLAKGSYERARISHGAFSMLFLHPSVDSIEEDSASLGMRKERVMYVDNVNYLAPGGIIAYIIPQSSLNRTMARMLTYRFTRLEFYSYPQEERNPYNKIIILGVYKPQKFYEPEKEELIANLKDVPLPPLPYSQRRKYQLPEKDHPKIFRPEIIDPEDLVVEVEKSNVWSKLEQTLAIGDSEVEARPPIPLHQGHIALLLASGNLDGKISNHMVKGMITKDNIVTETGRVDDKRKTTHRDRYSISVKILESDGTVRTLA